MRLLIVYGTTEGQTRKIAHFMRDRAEAGGHTVTVFEAIDDGPDMHPRLFDATIVAGSVHVGRYQATVEHFARAHAAELKSMRSAFVSVSLAAAGTDEDDVAGLEKCVAEFSHRTGWTPAVLSHVAGAFRYTQYDFFKRWALKYIAWRKGGPTDTGHDYELTDWDALGRFVDGFVREPVRAHA
jgi:menaquinone-dependent protoporphyrinogen oxidase